MSKLKLRALLGVSIFAASAALAANANAGTIYGAGSTLIQPYWAQIRDCYGNTGASYENPTLDVCNSVFTVSPNPLTANTVRYKGTGSGTGIAAIGSHLPSTIGDADPGAGTEIYSRVSYALSETSLTAANVNAYKSGGAFGSTTIPMNGIDELYGNVVQFPIAIAPVAIAYDPIYKKVKDNAGALTSYSLQFATASGKLELSREAYCKIFNGTITDWNDPVLAALGVSGDPADPVAFTAPIVLVGREESSGTTSLFTRHLAKVCGDLEAAATIPVNYYPDSGTTLTAANASTAPLNTAGKLQLLDRNNDKVVDFIWNKTTSNRSVLGTAGEYVLTNGSDGVAKYVDFSEDPAPGQTFTQARIGYVGVDYTLPYVSNSGLIPLPTIESAVLENSIGAFVDATPTNAKTAFGTLLPPDTDVSVDPDGQFDAAQPGDRGAPDNWAEPATAINLPARIFSPLADPVDGYPIIGTVNWISYTCYASSTDVDVITKATADVGIIGDFLDDPVARGILENAGLGALPTLWYRAINETFLDQTDPNGQQLTISPVGVGATNSRCTSVSPGA